MTKHNHAAAWFTIPNTNKVKNLNLKHIIKKKCVYLKWFFLNCGNLFKAYTKRKKKNANPIFCFESKFGSIREEKKST